MHEHGSIARQHIVRVDAIDTQVEGALLLYVMPDRVDLDR